MSGKTSSGGAGARVSSSSSSSTIPDNVKKMIRNIHEITGAHDDEIYATLKECSMDPNETAQKLLAQDTFHEVVKRKRDRRKENSGNKESVDSRWKPGLQGRGSRAGRGNFPPRHTSNDTGGKNSLIGKDNTGNQVSDKSAGLSSLPAPQEIKVESADASSSVAHMTNGLSAVVAKGTRVDATKMGGPAPLEHHISVKETPSEALGTDKTHGQLTSSSSNNSAAESQVLSPGVHFSASDPVLVPSNDSRIPGAAGTIKREIGSQRTATEQLSVFPSEGKSDAGSYGVGNSSVEANLQNKSIVGGKNQHVDTTERPSSAHGGSSTIRPSSNHSGRSQIVVGPQKVGSGKEWKPKPTNPNLAQGSSAMGHPDVPTMQEGNIQPHPVVGDVESKEAPSKLQRSLEELHISDNQHVIIPNHLHIPGAEKISFCFGSFDAISLDTSSKNVPNDSYPTPPPETSQVVEETTEQSSSFQNVLATAEEGNYDQQTQLSGHAPESSAPGEHDVPSDVTQEYGEPKQESDLSQVSHQYPIFHTSPGYGFGLMPSIMGSQLAPFETTESQGREVSRLPSYVVQPTIDPASYYAQFYRSGTDGDGRMSPFHSAGVAPKYNGSVGVLSPQPSQSVQEGANSSIMSTASPSAFVTQPSAGVIQGSVSVTQQHVPVFRQPTGIPIPQYPPNFFPYYFPPYIVPSPIHQFLNNSAYTPQPQVGNVYPAQPGPSAKFSLPQYKTGTSSGNSSSVGVASNYGPYGSSGLAVANSNPNEDLNSSQFKESNVYITGQQQSEGSAVWYTPPGRDVSGVQASSFYNIPSQGQVTFPPPQAAHGSFTGMYHTAQAVSTGHPLMQQQTQTMASAVDIAGPAPSVYQQPQHAQVNWPNNY